MTTTTDWDVRDVDTGSHAIVTDVTSATTDTDPAPALTVDDMHALMQRNERLARENAELRAQMGAWTPQRQHDPLTSPDRPPRAIRGVADLTEHEAHTALVAPTPDELAATDEDGIPETPMAAQYEWTTWLGDVHHADKRLAEAVAETRSWADGYTAPTIERTVVEPVEVDYSYRESEAALWAETVVSLSRQREQDGGVYGELAPERLDAQALVPTGAPDKYDPPQREPEPEPEPDDRVQRMTARVNRRDALAPASRVGASEPTSKSRQSRLGSWLRRRGDWVAVAGVIAVWTAVMSWAAWEVLA